MTNEMLAQLVRDGFVVEGGSPLEMQISEVVAYQQIKDGYLFGFLKLLNGRLAAVWETHAYLGDTMEQFEGSADYDPQLNHHERTLVRYGVKA